MNKQIIQITCDSTCDLSEELYKKHNIDVVPLGIALGDDLRHDGVDIDALGIFDFCKRTNTLPKTSAVSIAEYSDVFRRHIEAGRHIVHINLSSEFSRSYENACMAAQQLKEEFGEADIRIIDSRNLSSGSGHLVLMAAQLADQGLSAEAIELELNSAKERLDVSFVLQTLDYLQKGGRCPGVVAFGANLLKLRPEIEVVNGRMTVGKKYRGNMEKTILDYVSGRLSGRDDIDCSRIFITHSHVPQEIIDKVRALITSLQPFEEIIDTYAGCTISSHCGPDCLGVLFFRKK